MSLVVVVIVVVIVGVVSVTAALLVYIYNSDSYTRRSADQKRRRIEKRG